jgi:hypothetical protein
LLVLIVKEAVSTGAIPRVLTKEGSGKAYDAAMAADVQSTITAMTAAWDHGE